MVGAKSLKSSFRLDRLHAILPIIPTSVFYEVVSCSSVASVAAVDAADTEVTVDVLDVEVTVDVAVSDDEVDVFPCEFEGKSTGLGNCSGINAREEFDI
jgi:hypothetical protein